MYSINDPTAGVNDHLVSGKAYLIEGLYGQLKNHSNLPLNKF